SFRVPTGAAACGRGPAAGWMACPSPRVGGMESSCACFGPGILPLHASPACPGGGRLVRRLELGINARAMERASVMHGAPYPSRAVIAARARPGRAGLPGARTRRLLSHLALPAHVGIPPVRGKRRCPTPLLAPRLTACRLRLEALPVGHPAPEEAVPRTIRAPAREHSVDSRPQCLVVSRQAPAERFLVEELEQHAQAR